MLLIGQEEIWKLVFIVLVLIGGVMLLKAVASPNKPKDVADEIKKLADLKDRGVLTEEEFAKKKRELLDD